MGWPVAHVVLVTEQVLETQPGDEFDIELRLDRPDRHELAVAALVGVVERGAAVEEVDPALVLPHPGAVHRIEHRHERGRAVDHGRVDDLSATGHRARVQGREDPEQEIHGAAAEVCEDVDRSHRTLLGAHEVEGAGDRGVVDVVSGHRGPRTGLPPSGHPAVDQTRVAGKARVGAQPQPLGHAGTHPLDEDVGLLDQPQDHFGPLR